MPPSPMFPLGSVLVPGMILPLHVFEPRYRALVRDCLAGDREFGVVLISRGSEVGGGDVRTDVGTMARMLRVDETPDGRYAVGAVGVRRIRVDAWLDDDPYPRAEVSDWPDPESDHEGAPGADLVDEVARLLRRTAALGAELGDPSPPVDLALSDDPLVAGYQATAVAPLGSADRQALLAAASPGDRLEHLRRLLVDAVEVLDARLASG